MSVVSRFRNLAVVALCAGTAACGFVEVPSPPLEPPTEAPVAAPAPSPPADAPKAPAEKPPVRPKKEPARFNPAELMGLDPPRLEAAFGTPTAVLSQPPATIWRYEAGDCRIDVFLYMDLGTRALRVLAFEARAGGRELTGAAAEVCAGRIRETSHGGR
jgi:hypothetical protein